MPSSMSPLPSTARSRAGQRRTLRGADSADAASVGHRAGRADLLIRSALAGNARWLQALSGAHRVGGSIVAYGAKRSRFRRGQPSLRLPLSDSSGHRRGRSVASTASSTFVRYRSMPTAVTTATWPLRRPSSSARPQEAVAPRRGSRTAAQRELTVAQLRRAASRTTAACSSGAPLWLTAGRTPRAPRSRRLPNCRADPGVSRARRRRCC